MPSLFLSQQIIAPIITTTLDRPFLVAHGNVFHLSLIIDKSIVVDFIVFRASGQMNAQRAVLKLLPVMVLKSEL